jgi:hydrophobic/amphiphilic exporter-1 (mainly G- bacteria), HAE1 family
VAVIGGLVTSTLLTLIVIPCFYETIENIVGKLSNVKRRLTKASHA